MNNRSGFFRILGAVTSITTVIVLTACSCNGSSGIGQIGGLLNGNGGTTTVTSAETSSTTATTAPTSETTTAADPTTTTTAPTEPTTEPTTKPKEPETTTSHVHSWKYNGTAPASCTSDGKDWYICSGCGSEYYDVLPATGHNWHYNGADPATCTSDGKDWYICNNCGAEYYDVLPVLGHYWERTGGSPPDCTHDGGKWFTCTRCGEEYVEVLSAVGHDFQYVYHMDPLCEDYGYDVYQCTRCLDIEHRDHDSYPPLGHDKNDMIGGAMGHTLCCSKCGHEFPETFSAHEWSCFPTSGSETITHTYICHLCGFVDQTEAHHMVDGTCEYCDYSGPVG